jgi:hypothetical protein
MKMKMTKMPISSSGSWTPLWLRWSHGKISDLQARLDRVAAEEAAAAQTSSHSLVTSFVGYLLYRDGCPRSTYPLLVAIFCAYSCRILAVPLWTVGYFVPILSPVYRQERHWLSTHAHTVAILMHVSTGIVSLISGILQFYGPLRRRYKWLHRWIGRMYVLCGCACLHSLWQLQGVVGKGPGLAPSRLLQVFTLICISYWTIATATALYCIIWCQDHQRHKYWMIRSYVILTTPMMQRSANICMSFMVYWLVAAYALVVDVIGCSHEVLKGAADKQPLLTCLMTSVPTWSEDNVSMLSLEGFGHTEYLVFGASAWFALLFVIYMSEVAVGAVKMTEKGSAETDTEMSGIDILVTAASGSGPSNFSDGKEYFAVNCVDELITS